MKIKILYLSHLIYVFYALLVVIKFSIQVRTKEDKTYISTDTLTSSVVKDIIYIGDIEVSSHSENYLCA